MGAYDYEILSATSGLTPNSRGWVRFHCPACLDRVSSEDRGKACGLNTQTGGYNCFRCGLSGYLDGYGTGPEGAAAERVITGDWTPADPPPGFVPLYEGKGRNGYRFRRARQYLTGRGVPPEFWMPLGIGACDVAEVDSTDPEVIKHARRMNGRIVVPVRELNGVWRGYVGRAYYPKKPGRFYRAYMNHAGNWREDTVWNLPALFVDTDAPVLVCEGLFDALPSYPNSVALLGKPTEHQEDLLFKATRPVCMVLDGDAWRLSKAVALKLLVRGHSVGFVKLPPGRDPNDLDPHRLMGAAVESVRTQHWLKEIH